MEHLRNKQLNINSNSTNQTLTDNDQNEFAGHRNGFAIWIEQIVEENFFIPSLKAEICFCAEKLYRHID